MTKAIDCQDPSQKSTQYETIQIADNINRKPTKILYSFSHKKNLLVNIILLMTIFNLFRSVSASESTPYSKQQNIINQYEANTQINIEGTDKLKNALQIMQNNLYDGIFVSLQAQAFFDWISQKEGQIYSYIQKQGPQLHAPPEQQEYNSIFTFKNQFSKANYQINREFSNKKQYSLEQKQGMQQILINYSINFILLNPKYVSEQKLDLKLFISPQILNPKLAYENQNTNINENITQICTIITQTEWECNNTVMNYTKYWRNFQQGQQTTLLVNYKIRLMVGESNKEQDCSIQFQLSSIGPSFQELDQQNKLISFKTKQALILTDHRFKVLIFCVFISSIVFIQNVNAHALQKRLTGNHGMANKLSLFTISFCTIFDLKAAINFSYNIFNADVFYVLPTVLFIILYLLNDVKILTRVLMSHYHTYVQRMGGQHNARVSIKKALVVYYIIFFVSYQAYIFLTIFFEYQWWLIITTSFFIILPQIIRNVRIGNGGDDGFDFHYIIGYLSVRYLFILYDHACPDNVHKIKPSLWISTILILSLVAQLVILYWQSKYSARFFIPKKLRPNYYEYVRQIRVSEQPDIVHRQCAVCLLRLIEDPNKQEGADQYVVNESFENKKGLREQMIYRNKKYGDLVEVYVTPCNHMFHETCLKSWMQVKLMCPACRSDLPMI